MHLDKEHLMKAAPWVIGGGAALFLFLKLKGSGGSGAAQSIPIMGGGGGATPTVNPDLSGGTSAQPVAQAVANQFKSSSDRFLALRQQIMAANPADNAMAGGGGVVSKGWQQIAGGWADIAHPGHNISENEAVALGPQNHGPYAKGGGGFFGQIGSVFGGLVKNVAGLGAVGAPITLGTAFGVAQPAPRSLKLPPAASRNTTGAIDTSYSGRF